MKVEPRILSGFMELTPAMQLKFNKMVDIVRCTYEEFGFTPLDTPVLELSQVLLAKAGGETEKQIYRFERGDTDISMRFDLTVPLARYVAMHQNVLPFPFKRYQIGKVYRGERAQKGRFREFYQADIDVIGMEKLDIAYDAEMPVIIYQLFKRMGLLKFTINISNRKLMKGLMNFLGVAEMAPDVLRTVDKIAKIGTDSVIRELLDLNLDKKAVDTVMRFVDIRGSNAVVLQKLREFGISSVFFDEGLCELDAVIRALHDFGVPEANYKINLTITRGLDYYTGTIYETTLDEHPQFGSVCSGGRYDDLASFYTNKKFPGVGISIGLTRLFSSLLDSDLLDCKELTPANAMIIPITSEQNGAVLSLATKLRNLGLKIMTFTDNTKFKFKLNYADKIAVNFVIILGEDEVKNGTAVVKDMTSGRQDVLDEGDVSAFLINSILKSADTKLVKDSSQLHT